MYKQMNNALVKLNLFIFYFVKLDVKNYIHIFYQNITNKQIIIKGITIE